MELRSHIRTSLNFFTIYHVNPKLEWNFELASGSASLSNFRLLTSLTYFCLPASLTYFYLLASLTYFYLLDSLTDFCLLASLTDFRPKYTASVITLQSTSDFQLPTLQHSKIYLLGCKLVDQLWSKSPPGPT